MKQPLVTRPPYDEGRARTPRAVAQLPSGGPTDKGLPVDDALPGHKTFQKPQDDVRKHPKKDEPLNRYDQGAYSVPKDRDRVDLDEDAADDGPPNFMGLGPKDKDYSKTLYPYRDDKPNWHNAAKAPSKAQIDYAKRLLKQVGGVEPDWSKLDIVEISDLISGLKKKRGRPVWYGDGSFSHWEKGASAKTVASLWWLQQAPERLFQAEHGVRVAKTLEAILRGLDSDIAKRSRKAKVRLRRADVNNLRWIFSVTGNNTYMVKLRANRPRPNVTKLSKMDLQVACSCPAWRWQGPEYHAKKDDYQDPRTKLQGTASTPNIRDPERDNKVCKHVAAVLGTVRGWDIPTKRR